MKREDCGRALLVLQTKAVQATVNARSDADLLAIQRDIVAGARRLEAACHTLGADAETTALVAEYREAAEAALARLEHAARIVARLQGNGRALP